MKTIAILTLTTMLAASVGSAATATPSAPKPPAEHHYAPTCKGVKKDGSPCTRHTKDPSGYCFQHRQQAAAKKPGK